MVTLGLLLGETVAAIFQRVLALLLEAASPGSIGTLTRADSSTVVLAVQYFPIARGVFHGRTVIPLRGGHGMASTMFAVTGAAESGGHSGAADVLFSALYFELHRLAQRELRRRLAPSTLSVTTLLHEAYLNIAEREGPLFPDQARFMGYAARVMRGLIVDHARSRTAIKRGRDFEITSLTLDLAADPVGAKELSLISDALDELANVEPELAELVDLKFFCGFSFVEIAGLQNLSERTVQRRWEKARIYLRQALQGNVCLQ